MKPLTMMVEREAWIREHGTGVTPQSWQPGVTMLRDLLSEVDALRASLAAAEAKLADERKHADSLAFSLMKETGPHGLDACFNTTRFVIAAHAARRNAEIASLSPSSDGSKEDADVRPAD